MNKEINIEELETVYLSPDKMRDSEDLYILKEKIRHLRPAEQNILLLYVELGSYQKVADLMDCSHTCIYLKIKKIKDKIL